MIAPGPLTVSDASDTVAPTAFRLVVPAVITVSACAPAAVPLIVLPKVMLPSSGLVAVL